MPKVDVYIKNKVYIKCNVYARAINLDRSYDMVICRVQLWIDLDK